MTSLALNPTRDTLFAGCWDKSIWSWSTSTKHPSRRYSGHTDFVKAVLCLQIAHTNVLISGSADACIIIWNVGTGEKLHKLKGGHTRGILHLAVDPLTYPIQPFPSENGEEEVKENIMVLFSAGSDREIRRWRLSTDLSSAGEIDTENPIIQHETSVFALKFDTDEDLWTASADGTVKCLNRERGWEVDTTLNHGDYVDAVVVGPQGTWVVSAGRDEEVKVWDCSV